MEVKRGYGFVEIGINGAKKDKPLNSIAGLEKFEGAFDQHYESNKELMNRPIGHVTGNEKG